MTLQPSKLALAAEPPLLRVEELTKEFIVGRTSRAGRSGHSLLAIGGVTFDVGRGETFGLVGESGCGKSTAARCILRLVEPDHGNVVFDGTNVRALDAKEMRGMRRRMQIVFQDPAGSLDPRLSVRRSLEEPLVIHRLCDRLERTRRVREVLELVGVSDKSADRKPYAFSGGQRQRIGLARALILEPELVLLDEPVSALDVSLQAQILNLLKRLQEELGLTYIFIVHDLAVAEYFCDRLAVLYLGHVMELGWREQLFRNPLHPYTVALLSAAPVPEPGVNKRASRIILKGEVTPLARQHGCPFEPRCPIGHGRQICATVHPPLIEAETRHQVACHFPGELLAATATPISRPLPV